MKENWRHRWIILDPIAIALILVLIGYAAIGYAIVNAPEEDKCCGEKIVVVKIIPERFSCWEGLNEKEVACFNATSNVEG